MNIFKISGTSNAKEIATNKIFFLLQYAFTYQTYFIQNYQNFLHIFHRYFTVTDPQ